jgi:transposase
LPEDVGLLQAMVRELLASNAALSARVLELEGRLGLNSQNSSLPPSKDNFTQKLNRSLREKSGKKVGGQPGHEGTSLKFTAPDAVVVLKVVECSFCGTSLTEVASKRRVRRQVLDLPANFRPQTVEYQAEVKRCPHCAQKTIGNFPQGVNSTVQYGNRLLGLGVYLHLWHGLPYQRCVCFLQTAFGIRLSPATLERAEKQAQGVLTEQNAGIGAELGLAAVTCHDETGIRVGQKTLWVHSMSSEKATHLYLSEKRGAEGMQTHLAGYNGVAVHDGWGSYWKFTDATHASCNAHYLRDLKFCHEIRGQVWAENMALFLRTTYQIVQNAKKNGLNQLDEAKITQIYQQYDAILSAAEQTLPPVPTKPIGKKGRIKKSKERNLFERLKKLKAETLAFVNDFRIPFDNNLAERSIRMLKVVQKINGGWRTLRGAQIQLAVRTFLDTARKKGQNLFHTISKIIKAPPIYIPAE